MITDKIDKIIDGNLYNFNGINEDINIITKREFNKRITGGKITKKKELYNQIKQMIIFNKTDDFEKQIKTIINEQKKDLRKFEGPLIKHYGKKRYSLSTWISNQWKKQ